MREYVCYESLQAEWSDRMRWACCHVHARRKFEELDHLGSTQATATALGYFQRLFALEVSAEERYAARNQHAKPLMSDFKKWLEYHTSPPGARRQICTAHQNPKNFSNVKRKATTPKSTSIWANESGEWDQDTRHRIACSEKLAGSLAGMALICKNRTERKYGAVRAGHVMRGLVHPLVGAWSRVLLRGPAYISAWSRVQRCVVPSTSATLQLPGSRGVTAKKSLPYSLILLILSHTAGDF